MTWREVDQIVCLFTDKAGERELPVFYTWPVELIDVRINKIKVLWLPILAVQIASMCVCLWCHLLAAGCLFMSSCHSLLLLFTKTITITIIPYQTIWKTGHVMFKVHAQSLKVSTHIFVFMSQEPMVVVYEINIMDQNKVTCFTVQVNSHLCVSAFFQFNL